MESEVLEMDEIIQEKKMQNKKINWAQVPTLGNINLEETGGRGRPSKAYQEGTITERSKLETLASLLAPSTSTIGSISSHHMLNHIRNFQRNKGNQRIMNFKD